uniref:PQL-like protein n=1 Tax=Monsonia marlothii TaxID=163685 RepID=A0A0F7GXW0_9ROSI
MGGRPLVSHASIPHISTTIISHLKPSLESHEMTRILLHSKCSRRVGAIATMSSILLLGDSIFNKECANGFDFRLVAPDQTVEEAESEIRGHAQDLVQVKTLLESESWKEAQKELRRSSARLRSDIYTIIQSKPGSERPLLRKLYTDIFTNVSNLDYAARDKDATRVWECYKNIVVALDDILSRI